MTRAVDKTHREQEETASTLKEKQHNHADSLAQRQKEEAVDLKRHQRDTAMDALDATDAQSNNEAENFGLNAAILAESQRDGAKALRQTQLSAAAILKEAHSKAALSLEATQARAGEQHQQKDEVISWLTGGYSVKGE